jgi:ABC-type polysaccharide/polyol phosphate transport system ATPase subunit
VLLASHDRELIQRNSRRVIALDHGRIVEEKPSSPEKAPTRSESVFVNW